MLVEDVRTPELSQWKQQAAYLHRNHLDRVAAEERCGVTAVMTGAVV